MADSFADLWQSSAPTAKPQTLSSLNSNSTSSSSSNPRGSSGTQAQTQTQRKTPDVFALLASKSNSNATSSSSAYRPQAPAQPISRTTTASPASFSSTPYLTSYSQPASRPSSAQPPHAPSPSPSAANAASRSGDAFGDLFSSAAAGGANSSANMTLAARAKMEQEQRHKQQRLAGQRPAAQSGADAWAGLDALGAGGASIRVPVPAVRVDDADDWGLGDFGTAASTATATSTSAPGRRVKPTETKKQASSGAGVSSPIFDGLDTLGVRDARDEDGDEGVDDWGLGDFASALRGGFAPTPPSMSAPQDEDDILGMLSRPVQDVRAARTSISPSPPPPRLPPRTSSTNSSTSASAASATAQDPPPHILGQIVEMGFSVAQARGALLQSLSSAQEWDVQAALEMLLSQSQAPSPAGVSRAGTPQQPPQHKRQTQEAPQQVSAGSAPPKGRRERDLERQERQERLARLEREIAGSASVSSSSSASRATHSESSASTVVPAELAHHAERVLEIGKEVGRGVLGRASAFWREGRERVEKVLVEREESRGGVGQGRGVGRGVGRGGVPRWMQEQQPEVGHGHGGADGDGDGEDREHGLGGYADAHGDEDEGEGDHIRSSSMGERPKRDEARNGGDDGPGVDLFNVEVDDGGLQETTAPAGVTKMEREVEEVDLFSMPVPVRPAAAGGGAAVRSGPSRHTSSSSSSLVNQNTDSSSTAYRTRPSTHRPASASTSTPTPKPTKKRALIAASSSAIAQVATHRATGTAAFKLGQYADAAAAYSRALDVLPEGHLLRVPLLTNRALALMRTGECKGAERDCAEAARVVTGLPNTGSGAGDAFDTSNASLDVDMEVERLVDVWTPAQEPSDLIEAGRVKANDAGWADTQRGEGVGVDLVDGYVKARRRRAEALEMQEKWRAAAKDWDVLAAAPWVPEKVRGEARSGVGRCRRMLGEDAGGAASVAAASVGAGAASASASSRPKAPPAASKPKPRAPVKSTPQSSRTGTPTGAALKALQTSTAQAEAEDTLRHTLKDGVDARLAAWRGGKETNIRALLASLDTVLWPEILAGGVQVSGLGALITPAQVKKGYVKAIARVHPDKLNPSNSTVEQRMLANGVFGTLNEAWIAFQAGAK